MPMAGQAMDSSGMPLQQGETQGMGAREQAENDPAFGEKPRNTH